MASIPLITPRRQALQVLTLHWMDQIQLLALFLVMVSTSLPILKTSQVQVVLTLFLVTRKSTHSVALPAMIALKAAQGTILSMAAPAVI